MVDTAGTLVKAAEVLKEKGATSVMACCTHGVLSGPAYDRVANGVLDELVISDTIPTKKNAKKITVLTASSIIGEAIRRIHNNESVNSIFTTLLTFFIEGFNETLFRDLIIPKCILLFEFVNIYISCTKSHKGRVSLDAILYISCWNC